MDSLSDDDVSRRGLAISEPVTISADYTNPRTGETSRVPEGVNPSFAYRPGTASQALASSLDDKLAAADPDIADAVGRLKPPSR